MTENDDVQVSHAYPPPERPLKVGTSPDAVVWEEALIYWRVHQCKSPRGFWL